MKSLILISIISTLFSCSRFLYKSDNNNYAQEQFKGRYTEFFYQSKDGVKLHSWLVHAQGGSLQGGKRKGTIVFFHGNYKNLTHHIKKINWLTKEGYQIFVMDYRGFGKSEGMANQKGLYLDALSSLDKAYEVHKKYPAKLFIVYGQGLGGAVAARALPDSKIFNKVNLVVMDSSFHSYEDLAFDKVANRWYMVPLSPFTYMAVSDKMASTNYLTKISPIPLLVIHGIKDEVIPYKFGADLYHHASEPKWFWSISEGKHQDVFEVQDKVYRAKFLNFIDRKVTRKIFNQTAQKE